MLKQKNRFYTDNAKLKMFNAAMINILLTNQFKILEKQTNIEIIEAQTESERSDKTAYKDSKLTGEIEELETDLKSGKLLLTVALDDFSLFKNGPEDLDELETYLSKSEKETYVRTTLRNTVTILEKMLESDPDGKGIITAIKQANIRYDGRNKDVVVDENLRYGIQAPWLPNIVRVAKAFTNVSSDRMYRAKLSDSERIDFLKSNADTLFDSQIVATVLKDYFNKDVLNNHEAYKNHMRENIRQSLNPGENIRWIYSLDCGDIRPCTTCEVYLNGPSKSDSLKTAEGVGKIKGNRHYMQQGVIGIEVDVKDFEKGVIECPHYNEKGSTSSIGEITNKEVVMPEINASYTNRKMNELMIKKTFAQ